MAVWMVLMAAMALLAMLPNAFMMVVAADCPAVLTPGQGVAILLIAVCAPCDIVWNCLFIISAG